MLATVNVRSATADSVAVVQDISATGARIEVQAPRFERGDEVQLHLPLLPDEQMGEIAWTSGNYAGVRFFSALDEQTVRLLGQAMRKPGLTKSSMPVVTPPPSGNRLPTPEAKRNMDRAEVAIGASCRTTSGRRGYVVMIDLTVQGCCLFSRDLTLAPGQQLTLRPECLAGLTAQVQWSKGPLSGVLFDGPLDPSVFSHLAATFPWPLPESVKPALGPHGSISETVLRELNRLMTRTENVQGRSGAQDALARRPLLVGSRPGLAPQTPDHTLRRLFLG